MNRLRNESGQAVVLSVVFLAALLGAAAMVVDVGSWYREQRDTQSEADAAALASAQALPEVDQANALAAGYLNKNDAGAGREISFSTSKTPNDTVTVKVNRDAPSMFAKLFGINSVNVKATAVARAGGLRPRNGSPRSQSISSIPTCFTASRSPASESRPSSTSRSPGPARSASSTSTAATAVPEARSTRNGSCGFRRLYAAR